MNNSTFIVVSLLLLFFTYTQTQEYIAFNTHNDMTCGNNKRAQIRQTGKCTKTTPFGTTYDIWIKNDTDITMKTVGFPPKRIIF